MKKKCLLFLLCAALILLLCACRARSRVSVGFIGNLDYSMGPKDVTKKLGDPVKVTDDRDRFSEVSYTYRLEMEGVMTDVTFSFVDDKTLTSVNAKADAGSAENAAKLFDTWKEKEIAAHKNEKGYYCNDLIKHSDTEYQITLGTSQGAVGLTVDISVDGATVRIRSVYMD